MQTPMLLLLATAATLSTAAKVTEPVPGLTITHTLSHTCSRTSKAGDTIAAHYRGTLASDGKEFDASYNRGQPLSFQLGAGRVIKGWDLGLEGMCPGDKRTLRIAPELGYGNRGMGPIPAGSTLVFETELVSIEGVPKEALVVKKDEEEKPVVEKVVEKVAEALKVKERPKVQKKGTETEAAEPVQEENPQEEAEKVVKAEEAKAKEEL